MFLYLIQSYQKVPQTPLVSVSVLQDEKEVWHGVQVGKLKITFIWSFSIVSGFHCNNVCTHK